MQTQKWLAKEVVVSSAALYHDFIRTPRDKITTVKLENK